MSTVATANEGTRKMNEGDEAADDGQGGGAKVHWDQSQMRTEFANVINVFSTREEFSLLFGMNGTLSLGEGKALEVKLSNRIVLTPYAAKRLNILLTDRLAEYERRNGALSLTP